MRPSAMLCSLLLIGPMSLLPSAPAITQEAPQHVVALMKFDRRIGSGALANESSEVMLNYTGWLYDPSAPDQRGAKLDSSYDRRQPLTVDLAANGVIAGWKQGITGMRVGGKRRLLIPPALGYGGHRQGPVPANATLVFDIELLKVF